MTGTLAGERRFRADRSEIARARRFAVATAELRGDAADDLALITSELATNAVLHATGDFVVRIHVADEAVRVSVFDADPAPPVLRRSAITDPSGRGVAIVSSVAADWGVEHDGDGKWVWAEISVRP
jgi:anti-sigma regulatory factor (Ser/Thr protein kinase)